MHVQWWNLTKSCHEWIGRVNRNLKTFCGRRSHTHTEKLKNDEQKKYESGTFKGLEEQSLPLVGAYSDRSLSMLDVAVSTARTVHRQWLQLPFVQYFPNFRHSLANGLLAVREIRLSIRRVHRPLLQDWHVRSLLLTLRSNLALYGFIPLRRFSLNTKSLVTLTPFCEFRL